MESNAAPRPIVNIVGERVALGPLSRDYLDLHYRWENDFTAWPTDAPVEAQPRTRDEIVAHYDEWVKSQAEKRIRFTIYRIDNWQPIGDVGLRDLDFRNGTGVLGIMIGERDCRGKGYGTEATRLMLDYAFTVLSLHNVMLDTVEYNVAGIRAYTRAGFREIGRWREAAVMNGKHWDVIYMDCLAGEFESPVLSEVFRPDAPRP